MSTLPLYKFYILRKSLLIWPALIPSCLVIRILLRRRQCHASWAEKRKLEEFQNLFTVGSTSPTGKHNACIFSWRWLCKVWVWEEYDFFIIILRPCGIFFLLKGQGVKLRGKNTREWTLGWGEPWRLIHNAQRQVAHRKWGTWKRIWKYFHAKKPNPINTFLTDPYYVQDQNIILIEVLLRNRYWQAETRIPLPYVCLLTVDITPHWFWPYPQTASGLMSWTVPSHHVWEQHWAL